MVDVTHVFVLMMENRSFDHVFGYSGITGRDATTGAPTEVEGLVHRDRGNVDPVTGAVIATSPTAAFVDPTDVEHEFLDVLTQLCGPDAVPVSGRLPGGAYPPITSEGFVADYVERYGTQSAQRDLPMQCFDPSDLPVLTTLAREYAVCDHWFAAVPGPTWPNRFWVHGASPTTERVADSPPPWRVAMTFTKGSFPPVPFLPFTYRNGTIYDRLAAKGLKHRIYTSSDCAQVLAVKPSTVGLDVGDIDDLASDLRGAGPDFPSYVFIEPHPGSLDLPGIVCGSASDQNDMHPPSDVRKGEELVRRVYEAIHNSPIWSTSAFVVLFDEHGGYYDHVRPGDEHAPPPDDGLDDQQHGFRFDRRGVRIPALVISPLIPRNTVDHTVYDHTSVLATVEKLFGLAPLTDRDRDANDFVHLFSEPAPRTDTPWTLADVDCHPVDPAHTRTWVGDFLGLGHDQLLVYSAADARWWVRAYQADAISWTMVSKTPNAPGATFGDAAAHPAWAGDFTGAGHDQLLFYSASDGQWWLGSCLHGELSWSVVAQTRNPAGINFGDISHDPMWTGDFTGAGHDQLLFYSPGDGHWWLGSWAAGHLSWSLVAKTRNLIGTNFGDTSHDPTWIGDFTGAGHDQVLFLSPADGVWRLGSWSGGQLAWSVYARTRDPQGTNFGDTSHDPTWIGDFTGAGHDQVLFYSTGDQHWWLGDHSGGRTTWTLVGTKRNALPAVTHVGDFTGAGRQEVLFDADVLPASGAHVLGTVVGGRFEWIQAPAAPTVYRGAAAAWVGDFTGLRRAQLLGYQPGTGRWPLLFHGKAGFVWTTLRGRIGQILAQDLPPMPSALRLTTAFVANNGSNQLLVCSSADGRTWTPNQLVATGESTKAAPALVRFAGKLRLAFLANDSSNRLLLCSSTEGRTWTPSTRVGMPLSAGPASATAPALAAFRGAQAGAERLYLAYVRDDGSGRLVVTSSPDARMWSPGALVAGGESTKAAPAMAAFKGKLWLAFVANNSGSRLLVCSSTDGTTWTPNTPIATESSQTAPALAVLGERLYVAFVANDPSGRLLVCSTADGVTWTGNHLVAGGESTKAAPALAAYGGKLWLTFVANNAGNGLLVCSSTDGTTWTPNTTLGTEASQAAPALGLGVQLAS